VSEIPQINTTTHTFNYFDGLLTHENNSPSNDPIKTFIEQDGMVFLSAQHSLHGGGILAIGVTADATHYNFYRFDATSLALEKTFNYFSGTFSSPFYHDTAHCTQIKVTFY
jgi:hypothetical protein